MIERSEGDVFEYGGHEELAFGILKHQADFAADLSEVRRVYRQAAHFQGTADRKAARSGEGRR